MLLTRIRVSGGVGGGRYALYIMGYEGFVEAMPPKAVEGCGTLLRKGWGLRIFTEYPG
jgi:hypothetical protein